MDPSTGETACPVPDYATEETPSEKFNREYAAKYGTSSSIPADAWNVSSGGGTAWTTPPAPASPSYSPPPTARTTFDWDAVANAFTTSMWGGQKFAATSGNPASYYTATPSWLTAYVQSVQQSAAGSVAAQKALADQNAQAFQALVQAGAGASSALNRPFPVVVDPNNPVFQLRPTSEASAKAASAGIPTWGYFAAAAVGFLVWKKMRKRGGRPSRMSLGDE